MALQFKQEKRNTMGGVAWCFDCLTDGAAEGVRFDGDFTIMADRRGVRLTGLSPHIETMKDLQEFARVLSEAWKKHLSLKIKLEVVGGIVHV